MEFLSTDASEHNVGGLPREQSAENVYEAKIQNGRRWQISDLIIFLAFGIQIQSLYTIPYFRLN